ncbi:hypothetical protein QFC21_005178 [Naganishia friedmannii]|uniref:Uncharacterized protein n=1 Tax=Naganishia friedmannii TaxID=89922 RepID=A0ACC2VBM3_9TREE|nr:hypothetical protein QFC21_005178 [Naganishia friedmannii]
MANTLGMYRTVKRLGIPDSQIILMLADDVACNPRNGFPGAIYANSGRQLDLYGSGVDTKGVNDEEDQPEQDGNEGGTKGVEGVEVDYRGYEVNVENFLRVLTGRLPPHMPPSKHLLTDSSSNIFIYLTGHGGDGFLKFQDNEEIGSRDLGDAIGQMWEKQRYNKMMVMVDTCEANTMYQDIYSPNVIATGSSQLGENSYSHHNDMDIGVAVIDSFTHYVLQYLEGIDKGSKATLQDFFNIYDPEKIKSHPGIRKDLFPFDLQRTLVTDFFGGVSHVQIPPSRGNMSAQGGVANGTGSWYDLARGENACTGLPAVAQSGDERMTPPSTPDTSSSSGFSPLKSHDLSTSITGPQDWLVILALGLMFFSLSWMSTRSRRRSPKAKSA